MHLTFESKRPDDTQMHCVRGGYTESKLERPVQKLVKNGRGAIVRDGEPEDEKTERKTED